MKDEFVSKWQSQVKKGTLSFIVLNILKGNSYYGYEIIEEIKANTQIQIAEGTLYPLMNRLKNEELVKSKWVEQDSGIPRKYYELTEKGVDISNQMKKYWSDLSSSIEKIL